MCVLVCHLLPVAASEAQCVFVAVGGGVQPCGGVEAVVGEGLCGRGAQQLQEVQLDDVDGNAVCPGVRELEENSRSKHQCQGHIKCETESCMKAVVCTVSPSLRTCHYNSLLHYKQCYDLEVYFSDDDLMCGLK